MQSRNITMRFAAVMVATAIMALSAGLLGWHALAQETPTPAVTLPEPEDAAEASFATPTPPPMLQGAGDAELSPDADVAWTVGELTFESNYPQGFAFTAQIESSTGPISGGRIIWSHAPGTQRSRPIEVDPETGILRAEWNVAGGDAIPPWVGISYLWDVRDAEGNNFRTKMQYAEYSDERHAWVRSESDDIIVFSQGLPDDVNTMVLEAMARQRETYRAAWGDLLPYKPRAILFGDRDAWAEWQVGTNNPRVIGTTSDDWGGTAQVASRGNTVDLAYGTVPHEIAHLYQASFTIMAAGSWFNEGNATFFELNQQYDYEESVRAMAQNGTLPVLLQGTGPGVSGRRAREGYDVGYTWWKWLTATYGLEAHRELITLIDKGTGRNDAIEIVTGLPIGEVERRWRVWLGASEQAPTLIPTPTLFFFPSPTPFSFGN